MDRLRILSLIACVLMAPSLTLAATPFNDSIIAVVNSDVITLKDLKDYIGNIYRQLKIEHRPQQEIQQVMASYEEKGVNQLIEDKLILEAANKKGIEVRPELVEKRLKEIKNRYISEQDFINELNAQGLTVSDLKTKMINQLKSKFEVDIEVKDKIFLNPEDVTRYYNDHKNEFETKTKYDLSSIYIPFDKSRQDALKRIKEAKAKLSSGADFETIRKEYSQAPSVGILEQGQMVPAVEQEVFTLKEGEISQIVEVGNGFYIFKVNKVSLGGKQSLNEIKDIIYSKLYEQQFQDKFKTWTDKLRAKAYVEIRG
jgi:peptidyl-prolyl cis-trans isomerase SurA